MGISRDRQQRSQVFWQREHHTEVRCFGPRHERGGRRNATKTDNIPEEIVEVSCPIGTIENNQTPIVLHLFKSQCRAMMGTDCTFYQVKSETAEN